ncbi:7-cyano-7-deazaguanine synthase [Nonomuraea sp. MG754425]|uniref:7-cyano-7-deazaguanine synthase n=1 Tax=Nonomuraea sp. MG754425 TaxID=2570319 RepID=UPI001F1B7684|nr:7-cyano-7-deazaguanine synthase [Nonomuraea sp. MG754425]MCF6471269.1 7-cyano-7-deazaguanine synthase [Nonomuraea sp. MG754425]
MTADGADTPLAVVLFSGGLDSTVLAAHYRRTHRLLLLSFDYGQRHGPRELAAGREVAAHLAAEHHTVTVSGLGPLLTGCSLTDRSQTVPSLVPSEEALRSITIPNRNAFITDMAVAIAMARHAEVVALGVHHTREGYPMPDGRPDFFAAYQEMVRLASRGFHTPRVEVPFVGMQKEEIVAYGVRLDAPMDRSWTCYLDGPVHCGTCLACLTRRSAFALGAAPDPTVYDSEAIDDPSDPRPA